MTQLPQLPSGWQYHPEDPRFAHDGKQVVPVAQLLAPPPSPPPMAPPPPQSPPAQVTLPPGWQYHPSDPSFAHDGRNVVAVAQLLASSSSHAAPETLPSYGRAPQEWGEQNLDAADEAYERSQIRDGILWCNFPEFTGNESSLYLRFLPAWDRSGHNAWVDSHRHRVPSRLVPNPPGQGEVAYVECPSKSEGGGGKPCAICAVTDSSQNEQVKQMRSRATGLWQVINLGNPQIHRQVINGQSLIVPAVFRAAKTLHDDLIGLGRVCRPEKGGSGAHFTSPLAGFPIEVIKKRVNNGKPPPMNVEYSAVHHAHRGGPIDAALMPSFVIDLLLKTKFWRSAEEIAQIAANIQSAFAEQPQQPQQLHVPAGYRAPQGAPGLPAAGGRNVAGTGGAPAPQLPQQPVWAPPPPPPASALAAPASVPLLPPAQAPGIATGAVPALPGTAPAVPPVPTPGMPSGFGAPTDPGHVPF